MKKLPSLSVVFPAFNDEKTIGVLIEKAVDLLPRFARDYEIIVVNDGSNDGTATILKEMQQKHRHVRIINHRKNVGYGSALAEGFGSAKKEFIFYTDGDGQYDISEIEKLVAKMEDDLDMVTGYKRKRSDPWYRKVVGVFYNKFVKALFVLHIKDVDCDFRLFRRNIVVDMQFKTKSGAFDVEFMQKLAKHNVRFAEVAVSHFNRMYGTSQFFNFKNIARSLFDVGKLWLTQ